VVVCGALFAFRSSRVAVQAERAEAVRTEAANKAGMINAEGGIAVDAKKRYTRDEFRQLVMGKTQDEVIDLLGQPNSFFDAQDGRSSTWYYKARVLDPATGKYNDGKIEFMDGSVINVRW